MVADGIKRGWKREERWFSKMLNRAGVDANDAETGTGANGQTDFSYE
jgi:hypothetical protein